MKSLKQKGGALPIIAMLFSTALTSLGSPLILGNSPLSLMPNNKEVVSGGPGGLDRLRKNKIAQEIKTMNSARL